MAGVRDGSRAWLVFEMAAFRLASERIRTDWDAHLFDRASVQEGQ